MPIFALYNFDDPDAAAGTGVDYAVAADSALGNGAQNGVYFPGATATAGRVVLDGVEGKVKIYQNDTFQMDRGTLQIQFSQAAHVGTGANTVLSRDSVGETPGGFRIDVMPDGSVMISHETSGATTTFQTGPGFVNPGDQVNVVYSWDLAQGGALQITNTTTNASFEQPVPAGLTMDQGAMSQHWMVGVGQAESDPGILNNMDNYFQGSVGMFSLSDTVDNNSDGPQANPDTVETDEDTAINLIPVLANDTDPNGDPLTVTGTPTASNGVVTVNPDGTLRYTPNPNFNGIDTINYTITDPDGYTSSSTVTVTVNPVNDAPVAVTDTDMTDLNTSVVIDLIGNDTDVDNANGDLRISGLPTSPNGTVVVNPDGRSVTFTPTTGFTGTATINYTVVDPAGLTDDGVATVDVINPGLGGPDGIVRGTDAGDLIDTAYIDPYDTDRVDAGDAFLGDDEPNDDRIQAGNGNDTIYAGLGDDTVWAGTGDDSVYGGVGDDDLRGSVGDDTIYGGDGSDTVYGEDDDDLIDTSAGLPFPDIDYPGVYPADSNPENDRDLVYGGTGNDTIRTGDDADTIYGGIGNDRVDAGVDADLVYGGDGGDTIIGSEGADTIYAEDGNDLVYGGLDDTLGDILDLPDAVDLRPLNNPDLIYGGAGNDTIYGRDDNDTLLGGIGNDVLYGGVDNDSVMGDAGNDTIYGGQGVDRLYGGDDRDVFVLNPGEGNGSTIYGGAGGDDFDVLRVNAPAGSYRLVDTVTDSDGNGIDGRIEYLDDQGNVINTQTFENIEQIVPCFTPGTLIATPKGEVPVEELKVGDRVITRDNGIQVLRWVGQRHFDGAHVAANPHLRPVMVRRGSLGNGLPERDMMLSPNHRVLVSNDRTSLYFDEHEVLVAAKHMVGGEGIFEMETCGVTYIHIMFDQHEVVLSDGAWTESFQPGDYTLNGMDSAQRDEILEIFPELKTKEGLEDYTTARRTLKKHEAKLLVG